MWSRRALAPRSSPNRKSAIRKHLFGPQIPSAPIYTDFQKGLRVQKICGNLRNLWMTRFSFFHSFDDGGGNCIAVEVEEDGIAEVVKHRVRRHIRRD
jgi:hypothetical protein